MSCRCFQRPPHPHHSLPPSVLARLSVLCISHICQVQVIIPLGALCMPPLCVECHKHKVARAPLTTPLLSGHSLSVVPRVYCTMPGQPSWTPPPPHPPTPRLDGHHGTGYLCWRPALIQIVNAEGVHQDLRGNCHIGGALHLPYALALILHNFPCSMCTESLSCCFPCGCSARASAQTITEKVLQCYMRCIYLYCIAPPSPLLAPRLLASLVWGIALVNTALPSINTFTRCARSAQFGMSSTTPTLFQPFPTNYHIF